MGRLAAKGFTGRSLIRAYKAFCCRHTHAVCYSRGQMFPAASSHMRATIRRLEAQAMREAKVIRSHQRQGGEPLVNAGAQH